MAVKKQKKKKTTAAKYAASSAKAQTPKKRTPIRREVGAVVCLVLGVLTILCCFQVNAMILDLLAALFRGLLGPGFFILPFSFVMGFVILLLHDGRPVVLRMICTFALSVIIGSLVHLFKADDVTWSWAMLAELWSGGQLLASGGIVSGLIAAGLKAIISGIGAALLLLALFVLSLLTSLNMTLGGIIKAIKNRPRAEYDAPKREHRDPAEVLVNHVAQKQIEREERRRTGDFEFDIPIDEPPVQQAEASHTPKKKAASDEQTPSSKRSKVEQLLRETAQLQTPAAEQKAAESVVPEQEVHQFPPLVIESAKAVTGDQPLPELPPEEKPMKKEEVRQEAAKIAQEIVEAEPVAVYQYPPADLLRSGSGAAVDGTAEMRQNAERLNDTLSSFGIEAQIINVTRGPSVTRYELELNRGVKLSKVTNLADDIALSLGASGVRIAAIPDKISVVGIEVPNRAVSMVLARDVIDSPEFQKNKSRISFAVGKDIGGSRIIGDIARLPHMLIAGTTGSGKSVCMNSLIVSLLYKAKPDEVKLIMIDPKMVELGVYNGIPHLLIPVVTDPKKAAGALQWAVTEMMRRYRLMADTGVRDLESFNKIAAGSDELEPMPQIVVVIDELADLMLVAAKEVEESICRIAQMGRAAGIHLVIATQRPSADVITGLMKANIPSRIAFAVASAMESRIILDTSGAEKLVGKGDMLYAPLGQGKPKRVQGCFITDEEVQSVVDFVKKSDSAQYSTEILEDIERRSVQSGKNAAPAAAADQQEETDGDEMTPAAVEVLLETGQASVSMLQRRLKLGYARAARIMDELEEKGIVGPFEGSKPRQMLINREQWERMKDGSAEEFNQAVEEEIP